MRVLTETLRVIRNGLKPENAKMFTSMFTFFNDHADDLTTLRSEQKAKIDTASRRRRLRPEQTKRKTASIELFVIRGFDSKEGSWQSHQLPSRLLRSERSLAFCAGSHSNRANVVDCW